VRPELAKIISYPTIASGIILLFYNPPAPKKTNKRKLKLKKEHPKK